jgi:hypothetical protein
VRLLQLVGVITRSAEPARSRSSRRTRTTTSHGFAVFAAPRRTAHRPRSRAPVFLSPSRHPLRGRNTQDGQARKEPTRVAHRSYLDRTTTTTTTDETLAGPLARWPRSQPGVFEIASRSRQSSSIEGESYSHTLDVAPTDSRTLYRRRRRAPIVRIRLCCRVCTLHCRFTYKAAHRAARCIHPPPPAAGYSHPIGLPYGRPPHHTSSSVCLRLPVVVRVCASVKEIVPIVVRPHLCCAR